MERRLKQRVIGAIVLVALGVIFIPMLLTGPVDRNRVDVPIEIPPRPEAPISAELPDRGFSGRPAPGRELAEWPQPVYEASQSDPPEAPAASEPASPAEESLSVGAGIEPAPAREDPAPLPIETAGTDSDADAVAPPRDMTPEPEMAVVASSPEAVELASWVVQVGGFRNQDNALRLRDKLRGADFGAYVDRTDWQGSALYRVRVGPVAKRGEAEVLAQRLQSEQSLEGLIVKR